jgi:hypothetical protein
VWVYEDNLCPKKRPDVSGSGLEEAECYRMVSNDSRDFMGACVAVAQAWCHGWCGPRVVTQHGTCAGTGHTDVAKRERSWLGIDRQGRQSLKGVRM